MSVVYRASASHGDTSFPQSVTVAITPAIGDLFFVFCNATDNSSAQVTCVDDNGGTYDLVDTAPWGTGQNFHRVFVRTALFVNATPTNVTVNLGGSTAAVAVVIAVQGCSRHGSDAVLQYARDLGSAGDTPSVKETNKVKTENMTIGAVASGTVGTAPPLNWIERKDVFQLGPPCALEVVTRNSGFSGKTVNWSGPQSTAFVACLLEIDGSDAGSVPPPDVGTPSPSRAVAVRQPRYRWDRSV